MEDACLYFSDRSMPSDPLVNKSVNQRVTGFKRL